jgi:hypothetical protein
MTTTLEIADAFHSAVETWLTVITLDESGRHTASLETRDDAFTRIEATWRRYEEWRESHAPADDQFGPDAADVLAEAVRGLFDPDTGDFDVKVLALAGCADQYANWRREYES